MFVLFVYTILYFCISRGSCFKQGRGIPSIKMQHVHVSVCA